MFGEHNVIDELDIRVDDIYLDDEVGRYSLYGLYGDLKLHSGDEIRQSHLSWIGGAVYRIEIGPGRIDWESNARNLELGTWNLELGTWNLELGTRNSELGTRKLEVSSWKLPVGKT